MTEVTKLRLFAVVIIVALGIVSFASIATKVSNIESDRVKRYQMFMK